ncbi:MAG: DUF481 domain-containing protein [Desulfobacteraceae bacterium]|nr:DUF481 domain-containing protein [Desulfobacteraceae bacterium]MBC2757106.1 DUF481 domain-containing protein [Desulfobacteraceae bacterium]MBC2763678.1 DUF481 domain-containing protein [ANME-2 cluster archaeon]
MGKGGIENRVEQQLEADNKPFYANLRLGGLYDSRVGSASGGGDEDSDTAFAATLFAGWQAPLEGNFGLSLDYGGYADFHQDFDEYDVIDQSVSFEPQYISGQSIYSMPFAFNYAMEDGETDYSKYTVSPTWTYLIPKTSQAIAVYGIGSIIDDRDNSILDEDGEAIGAGCAYLLFFDNLSRIRLSLDYQHTKYDARVIDYDTPSVSTDKREDDSIVAGVDVQYQFNKFFGIFTNYSFIHSNSNVDIYEYNRHIVEAGIAFKY